MEGQVRSPPASYQHREFHFKGKGILQSHKMFFLDYQFVVTFSGGAVHRRNMQVSALLQESPDAFELTEDLLIDRTAVHW